MSGPDGTRFGRRRLLAGSGVAAAGALLAACGTASPPAGPSASGPPGPGGTGMGAPPTTTTPAGPVYTGDARHVALGAALANFAADLYGDAVSRAALNGYGVVPPVVLAFLRGAVGQHATAASAWNEVLTDAGRPAVSGIPPSLDDGPRRAAFDAARTPTDLLSLSVDLESTIAATLVDRLALLTTATALTAAATIAPVAAARAATAGYLLGRAPGTAAGPGGTALGREVDVG